MRHREAGLTLIELAVVVLIMGLVVAVVFPTLSSGVLGRTRFSSSVGRIASVITYARNQAACKRLVYLFHIDIDHGEYWVTAGESTDDSGEKKPALADLCGRLPDGVRFQDVEVAGSVPADHGVVVLRFRPEGWADPATIRMAGPGGVARSVVITAPCGLVETSESRYDADYGR